MVIQFSTCTLLQAFRVKNVLKFICLPTDKKQNKPDLQSLATNDLFLNEP